MLDFDWHVLLQAKMDLGTINFALRVVYVQDCFRRLNWSEDILFELCFEGRMSLTDAAASFNFLFLE